MDFKSITKFEDCLSCQGCCKFALDEKALAPILTWRELKQIQVRSGIKFSAKKFQKSERIFQLRLKKSRKGKNIFICPFFNEKLNSCLIEKIKPLECKLAPFIFIKEKNGKIFLACYDKSECPSLKKINKKEMSDYKKYLQGFCQKEAMNLLQKFPELAWEAENKHLPKFLKVISIK